jgi:hypothetical protein
MPEQPKTDPKLLARLALAAKHEMTAEEVRRQRVSFVYGNLPHDNPMTRNQVADAIKRLEGEPA